MHLLSTTVTRIVHEVLGVVLFSLGHLQSEVGVSTKQPLLWLHVSWVWGPWPGRREEPRAACPGGVLRLGGAFNKSSGVFAPFPPWEKEMVGAPISSWLRGWGQTGMGLRGALEHEFEGERRRILCDGKMTGRRVKSGWLSVAERGRSHWTGAAVILSRGSDDRFLVICSPWCSLCPGGG